MQTRTFIGATLLALVVPFAYGAEPTTALEAPAGDYVLEKTHASLLWRINHMGMSNYTARFKTFDAKVHYDPSDISKNSVEATIDISSVETDYPGTGGRDFNQELKSEPFFNVLQYPKAKFVSTSVQLQGPRSMKVAGNLTLLGITKPLELDVVLNGAVKEHPFAKVPWLGFSAKGRLKRTQFELNPMPQLTGVAEEVEVIIQAEFIKQ